MTNKEDILTSIRRTLVPLVVVLLSNLGIERYLDAAFLSNLISVLIGVGYYCVVRMLESKWPWLGVLLGSTDQPTYGSSTAENVPIAVDSTDTSAPGDILTPDAYHDELQSGTLGVDKNPPYIDFI